MTTPTPPKQPKPAATPPLDIDPRTKFPRLPEGMIFEVTPPEGKYHSLVSGFLHKPAQIKVLKWSDGKVYNVYGQWSAWKVGLANDQLDFTSREWDYQNSWAVDRPAKWPFFSERGHWQYRTRSIVHDNPGYTEQIDRQNIQPIDYTPEGIIALAGEMAEAAWKREELKRLLGKHEPIGRSDLPEEIQVTLRLAHAKK